VAGPTLRAELVMEISVIICTHNPRRDYLERALGGLRGQSLATNAWELLLVDNASAEPLSAALDLGWHPHTRLVREERLGLTPARLRGIAESAAPLLVYVDDDNVLAPDYLAAALAVREKHSLLGAWSGQVLPEFEVPPPPGLEPWLRLLCLRPLTRECWGNHTDTGRFPFGAGMCVRRVVAERYAQALRADPARLALDRTGDLLYSSGDLDVGMTAVALGLGNGLFPQLCVTHLIPERRLEEAYLLKLARDGAASYEVFRRVWGLESPAASRADRMVATYKLWRASARQRKFNRALREGEALGQRLADKLGVPNQSCCTGIKCGTSRSVLRAAEDLNSMA